MGSTKLAGPTEIRFTGWETFVESAAPADVGSPVRTAYWFRGQPNASDPLRPSLARLAIRHSLTKAQTLRLERRGLDEFKRHAAAMLPAALIRDEAAVTGGWRLM